MGNNLNETKFWDDDSVRKIALEFSGGTKSEFKKKYPGAYYYAVRNKLIDSLFPNPLRVSSNLEFDKVKELSKEYTSRGDLQKRNRKLYMYILRRGWIEQLFPNKIRTNWDEDSVRNIAKQYKSRKEFETGKHQGAFGYAVRNKMLDDLFPERLSTSVGERIVDEFLTKNGINFKREKTFEGCFVEKNGKCFKLKYDFYLPEKNILIEYDGIGHYKPVDRFGGQEGFATRRMYDFIKNKFAESQNMKLIRIPYTVRTIDEVGKYLNTLTESDITRIVRRVIKEQQGDLSKCANQYIDFLFEPSIMDGNNEVIDGGDLYYWNNNEIPELNDLEAFNRFIKHLQYVIEDVEIFSGEECGNISFEEIVPIIQNLYRKKITNTTNGEKNPDDKFYKLIVGLYSKNGQTIPINVRRRMTNSSVIGSINNAMMENPPNEFDDEFEYADNILNWTAEVYYPYLDDVDDRDEIIDFMKEEYSDIIFDYFYSQE